MSALRITVLFASALLLAAGAGAGHSMKPESAESKDGQQARQEALAEFNSLIGSWRGVGMPRRRSARGAWIEQAEWVWDFKGDEPAMRYVVKKGKLLQSARLTYDTEKQRYRLHAVFAGNTKRTYRGRPDGKKLVLTSPAEKDGYSYRITITRLNDKRTLVLHERRRGRTGQFFRVAGIGYTRKGTSLAAGGSGEPECIVTGGKGTIRVSYRGKTYFVCCAGCRQAFEDDPQGILAEYRRRLAKRNRNADND